MNEKGGFGWSRFLIGAIGSALFVLVVALIAASLAPATPSKDEYKESARIYSHTYDEVFQASLEALERMGLFATEKDKDKGTISGNGKYKPTGWQAPLSFVFDARIETLNSKPETRVTLRFKKKGAWGMGREEDQFGADFHSEVLKVLATYR